MIEILYPVARDSYSAEPAIDKLIVTDLPGGLPRTELDFIGGFFRFQVVMQLHKAQYEDALAKYNQFLRNPQPVRFNLISYGLLSPHLCWFVPNSWQLVETDARDAFKVQFALLGSAE